MHQRSGSTGGCTSGVAAAGILRFCMSSGASAQAVALLRWRITYLRGQATVDSAPAHSNVLVGKKASPPTGARATLWQTAGSARSGRLAVQRALNASAENS